MKCGKYNVCPDSHVFCRMMNQLPFYEEVKIPKTTIQKLPRCFEETALGEPKGALRQFRRPDGAHILEYENVWILHKDKIDPRFDPLGHLINDAPHVLALGSLFVVFILVLFMSTGGERK